MEALQTKQTKRAAQFLEDSGKRNLLGGLNTLVVREHSSGSVVWNTLYYAQWKHKQLLPWHSLLFGFQLLFVQTFVSIRVKELKYLFNWGSSFWLTLFWECSMKFLSVAIVYAEWAAVFDLKIPSWILLDYYIPMLYLLKVISDFMFIFYKHP